MEERYNKSKIYKIVDNTNSQCYIGSTIESLRRRLSKHRAHYKQFQNNKKNYISSFEILKNDNYDIILLEEFSCETKEQLHARERYWIEKTECVNMLIPSRTDEEWRELHRDDKREYDKQYRENNKEKINERGKQYRENNKEKINERRRQWRLKKKEEKEKISL